MLHIIAHFVKNPLSFHVALRSTWHFMQNKLKKRALIAKKVFKRIDHYRTHRITCEKDRVSIDQFRPSYASSFNSEIVPNASESSSVQEEEIITTITEETENDKQVVPEFIDHRIPEFSDLNIDLSVTPIGSTPDRRDWRTVKQTQKRLQM